MGPEFSCIVVSNTLITCSCAHAWRITNVSVAHFKNMLLLHLSVCSAFIKFACICPTVHFFLFIITSTLVHCLLFIYFHIFANACMNYRPTFSKFRSVIYCITFTSLNHQF